MAVDMFIKIGDIDGETHDKTYGPKKFIDVLAWSWGLSQSGSSHMGGGAGAGKVNVQDLSFTKYVDASTHALVLACCTGEHIDEAVFVVRKAGKEPLEYIKLKVTELIMAS